MNFRDKYYIIAELGVERTKLDRYCHYALKIEKMIDKGEQIPTAWIVTLLSYYTDVRKEERAYFDKLNRAKIEQYTKEVLEHFSKEKEDYVFSGKYERTSFTDFDLATVLNRDKIVAPPNYDKDISSPKKRKRRNTTYSFETLLRSCIGAYLALQDPKETKEQAIRFFLSEIQKYIDSHFTEQHKKKMSLYKAQVIAGYLTMKVADYRLSSKVHTECTNPNIYEATRNALRPKKKKD